MRADASRFPQREFQVGPKDRLIMHVVFFHFQGGVPEQILWRDGLQALPLLLHLSDQRLSAHLMVDGLCHCYCPRECVRQCNVDRSWSSRTHFSNWFSHNDSRFLMFICNLVSRNHLSLWLRLFFDISGTTMSLWKNYYHTCTIYTKPEITVFLSYSVFLSVLATQTFELHRLILFYWFTHSGNDR